MTPVPLLFLLNTVGFGSQRSSVSTTGGVVTDRSENPTPPSSLPCLLLTLHLFIPSTSSLLSPLFLRLLLLLVSPPSMLLSYALSFRSFRIWARSLSILSPLSFLFSAPCSPSKCVPFGCSYSTLPAIFSDQFASHPDRIWI